MEINTCPHCGCPQIGDNLSYYDLSYHYASCEIVTEAKDNEFKRGYHIRKKFDSEKSVYEEYKNKILAQIKYALKKIFSARKEITNACLDEVYLCIYDCMRGRLEIA